MKPSWRRAGWAASSPRTFGRLGFPNPAVVRPVVANAAKLKLALHAAQLRVGDSLDHGFQIAVDAVQCGAPARVVAAGSAKLIIPPILIAAGKIVGHLRTPCQLILRELLVRRCA